MARKAKLIRPHRAPEQPRGSVLSASLHRSRRRRVVLQQPALTFQGADLAHVLRDLQRTQILSGLAAYGEVTDVYESAGELDPELGHALPPFAKIAQDAIHHVHAARRM